MHRVVFLWAVIVLYTLISEQQVVLEVFETFNRFTFVSSL